MPEFAGYSKCFRAAFHGVFGGVDSTANPPMLDANATGRPRVSIVIPAYRSEDTLARCLEGMLAQRGLPGYEVVVVDSSPDGSTAEVARRYPDARLVVSAERLLPHAARNLGVRHARGELLVFTDPDIYPPPDWLRTLVAAYDDVGGPVVGSLSCYGERWLDFGIHLCKFSKWLPGGAPRPVDMSPTANMLLDRATFEAAGGFDGAHMQGDASFSWDLRSAGHTLWFVPAAEAAHHHLSGLRAFLRERYRRGVEFGELRATWQRHGRGRSLLYLAVSLLPLRLARVALLVAGQSRRAGKLRPMLSTLPVWLAGHAASLLGESRAHLRRAIRSAAPSSGAEQAAPASCAAASASSSGAGAVPP